MEKITNNTSDHTKYQESFVFFFLLALAEGVKSTNEKKKNTGKLVILPFTDFAVDINGFNYF